MSKKEQVLLPDKRNSAKTLENFAIHIEEMLRNGTEKQTMEKLVCRLLTSEDQKVAAAMTAKWVEWRFGKAKETHEHNVKVEMTVSDADRIIREYFGSAGGREITLGPSH